MSPISASHLRRSRTIDRSVTAIVTSGGSLVLVAVAFLMIFLIAQCVPLFRGARIQAQGNTATDLTPLAAREDEYRQQLFLVATDGKLHVVTPKGPGSVLPIEGVVGPVTQARFDSDGGLLVLLDADGTLRVFTFAAELHWVGDTRVVAPVVKPVFAVAGAGGMKLLSVGGDTDDPAVLLSGPRGAELVRSSSRLALSLAGEPVAGAVAHGGREVWLASPGQLAWFQRGDDDVSPLAPAATAPLPARSTAMALDLGDVTCLVGDSSGAVTGWQVLTGEVAGSKILDRAAVFPGVGAVKAFAVSLRDKAFAVLRSSGAELDHLTTRRTLARFEPAPPGGAVVLGLSPRGDGAFLVGPLGTVHRWKIDAPHPEVTAAALLLPVRYEGYARSQFSWQSTGGSESFEPKLSLIPLFVGTIKGALYALVFSAPCALAAALFISQFAPPRLHSVAKPVVELMAALPSVVIGFLAALFLAPIVERHIVGVLLLFPLAPLAIVLAAAAWQLVPVPLQRRTSSGRELVIISALLALVATASFAFERPIEKLLFGGDFKVWLATAGGITFDQRNAVVVGFALGFAVIPIIFTLAEDAFSNVPATLISASLALGATRWQAARTVAIPAASPGLFAAVMIGFGRAVGETMIVLMATGNTPILSLSPFSGMRTMSACIAVELPEAPYGGTLYRVLILTALALFVMTFVLNTVAVVVSNRLRRRFGRLAA